MRDLITLLKLAGYIAYLIVVLPATIHRRRQKKLNRRPKNDYKL